jgi:thiol-disulfide isomerase/thioredoxin
LAITTLDGKEVRISDFRGRVVLLNFWATWCAPCIREMPSLDRLQAELGHDVDVLAVSEDSGGGEAVTRFLAKTPVQSLTFYLDEQKHLARAFEARGLPTTFIIDQDGRIRARLDGAAEWDSPEMATLLRSLAAGRAPAVRAHSA